MKRVLLLAVLVLLGSCSSTPAAPLDAAMDRWESTKPSDYLLHYRILCDDCRYHGQRLTVAYREGVPVGAWYAKDGTQLRQDDALRLPGVDRFFELAERTEGVTYDSVFGIPTAVEGPKRRFTEISVEPIVAAADVPPLTDEEAVVLRARATAPLGYGSGEICVSSDTDAALLAALEDLYDEVVVWTVDVSEVPYPCTLTSAGPIEFYRPDVIGINVWRVNAPLSGEGRTVLFRWDGSAWVHVAPADVGVTVTTAIS